MIDLNDAFSVDAISLDDETFIVYGTEDPTITAPAQNAPMSMLYIRKGGEGLNQLWQKTGPLDNDYTYIDPSSTDNTTVIEGQTTIVYLDPDRDKELSIGMNMFTWSSPNLGNNDWVAIDSISDSNIGHVMPFPCTMVGATVQCVDTNGYSKDFEIYINDVSWGVLFTLSGDGPQFHNDILVDIDLEQLDKVRIKAIGQGNIEDTIISLWVRWRAV